MKTSLTTVSIQKLKLDIKNPRFAELYSGSDNEDELIEYLLYNESAEEVAKGITKVGEFYKDRPLWVLKDGGNYLVKDGNRRCAAVKALNFPSKYGLNLPKNGMNELPVLIYDSREDLETRILQEHTNSLFREWDRIAKALEVNKMYSSGSSLELMKELDSQPAQLIKLAEFYYEAVKIGKDDLKRLLRRGRGDKGGKTIIFERLFSYSKLCGYSFRGKPSYKILISNKKAFENYVNALINYLINHPKTKTEDVDGKKEEFLKDLEPYGFQKLNHKPVQTNKLAQHTDAVMGNDKTDNTTSSIIHNKDTRLSTNHNDTANSFTNQDNSNNPTTPNDSSSNNNNSNTNTRKSIKKTPSYKRKKIPATLDKLIKECYSIDADLFPNARVALSRVTFECTLKYIVENTKYNGKSYLSNSSYFRNAFFDKSQNKRTYTDFSKLKSLFTELISDTGIKKAFESFELEKHHQIIHNYHVGALTKDAITICENMIPLIDFMLQTDIDLVNSLDKSKL